MSTNLSRRNTTPYQLPSPMPSPPRSSSPTSMMTAIDKCAPLPVALFHPILTPKDDNNNEYLSPPAQPIKTQTSKKGLLAVIQKYISDLEGRDKSIKIIQYAFKILLHYRWVNAKRWSTMVSHFSQTRKILRVGHGLGTFREMIALYSTQQQQHPLRMLAKWCALFITFGNELADDLFCFYKMGVFGPSIGKKAEKVSIYCWFLGIFIDLKSNIMSLHSLLQQQRKNKDISMEEQQLNQQKIFLAQVSCTKLMMDGIFCACDIWEPSFSSGVQAWSGFFSGSLSGYKLWCKFRSA
ncbi:peroxisomal biogenesis factor 11-domain-containing protein [Chlamydoabsidia padenii]|nr:peroxisomal biogenesis factor 11-domain-containing protein [Chlamydoabsidia padenii]